MNKETIYFRLKEAAELADIIEAAETGYVSLDGDDIRKLDGILLDKIREAMEMQHKKISGAATPEIIGTH